MKSEVAPAAGAASIRFLSFHLDRHNGRLTRAGQSIQLRPKTWAVLLYLAERPGALVTRHELFAAVWPDVVVTPDTLTKSIGELRVALADDSKAPRCVETVHRRGYRFIAEIQPSRPGIVAHGSDGDESKTRDGERSAAALERLVRRGDGKHLWKLVRRTTPRWVGQKPWLIDDATLRPSPESPAWEPFLVQLSRDARWQAGIFSGRVHHLGSGCRARFNSAEELMAILSKSLGEFSTAFAAGSRSDKRSKMEKATPRRAALARRESRLLAFKERVR